MLFRSRIRLEAEKLPPRYGGRCAALTPDERTAFEAEGRPAATRFRVRPGVSQVKFGLPGLRLGYARDAVASYFVFKTLREKGVFPKDMRFQISIPMVNSVVRPLYFPDPADLAKVRPGYEESLGAEIAVILARIPNEYLAIQWDCAWEVSATHGSAANYPGESDIETHTAPIERLSKNLPDAVALGFHFCFGTFGGWPAFAPDSLARTVEIGRAHV